MTLSKDRLRKIHGIQEPTGLADPTVLARRKFHEAAATWLAKRSYLLHASFAITGFVVILLPMFLKSWRAIIESAPIVGGVFHNYSTFSGWALTHFFILMMLFLVRSWQGKFIPAGVTSILSYSEIVDMELYPRTRREEFAYWIDIFFGIASTTLCLFLPFGAIAYFIRIG